MCNNFFRCFLQLRENLNVPSGQLEANNNFFFKIGEVKFRLIVLRFESKIILLDLSLISSNIWDKVFRNWPSENF